MKSGDVFIRRHNLVTMIRRNDYCYLGIYLLPQNAAKAAVSPLINYFSRIEQLVWIEHGFQAAHHIDLYRGTRLP